MRFLLANNHCISDSTAGVAHSLRTIIRFLAEAGHTCQVLTTARFDAGVTFTLDEHLATLGVPHERLDGQDAALTRAPRPVRRRFTASVVRYALDTVPVTLLRTRHHDEARPDPGETAQYLALAERLLDDFAPDQLIACNSHPMIGETLARARARGVTTVFTLRGLGYDDRRYFDHVDHVFTTSRYVSEVHRETIGLVSTPLDSPIDWSAVLAPADTRAFVTFVHPSLHKGVAVFARLADMLGARRPDIPLLVVQSGRSAGWLNALPGFDWSRYPQIMAAPPVARAAEFFALTRILLVPSLIEAFGRVAAEAMINGVPAIVSDRGGLPDTVGGDFAAGGGARVLPLPDWMVVGDTRLPTEADVQPWFDATCALWDDPDLYARVSARARDIAAARYSEDVARARHVDYLTSLKPGGRPFAS
jgi:glycosyltransferase involved in cell wall biosynthesis